MNLDLLNFAAAAGPLDVSSPAPVKATEGAAGCAFGDLLAQLSPDDESAGPAMALSAPGATDGTALPPAPEPHEAAVPPFALGAALRLAPNPPAAVTAPTGTDRRDGEAASATLREAASDAAPRKRDRVEDEGEAPVAPSALTIAITRIAEPLMPVTAAPTRPPFTLSTEARATSEATSLVTGGPADGLRQDYGSPPKRSAKAEAGHHRVDGPIGPARSVEPNRVTNSALPEGVAAGRRSATSVTAYDVGVENRRVSGWQPRADASAAPESALPEAASSHPATSELALPEPTLPESAPPEPTLPESAPPEPDASARIDADATAGRDAFTFNVASGFSRTSDVASGLSSEHKAIPLDNIAEAAAPSTRDVAIPAWRSSNHERPFAQGEAAAATILTSSHLTARDGAEVASEESTSFVAPEQRARPEAETSPVVRRSPAADALLRALSRGAVTQTAELDVVSNSLVAPERRALPETETSPVVRRSPAADALLRALSRGAVTQTAELDVVAHPAAAPVAMAPLATLVGDDRIDGAANRIATAFEYVWGNVPHDAPSGSVSDGPDASNDVDAPRDAAEPRALEFMRARQQDGDRAGTEEPLARQIVQSSRRLSSVSRAEDTVSAPSPAVASPGAAVTRPAIDAPAAAATLDAELPHQIVQGVRLQWRNGVGDAKLQLNPEHLGHVTVSLRVEGGAVSAVLHADSPGVQAWIEQHQQELRSALEGHGLQLARLFVRAEADGRRERQPAPRPQTPARPRRTTDARFEVRV